VDRTPLGYRFYPRLVPPALAIDLARAASPSGEAGRRGGRRPQGVLSDLVRSARSAWARTAPDPGADTSSSHLQYASCWRRRIGAPQATPSPPLSAMARVSAGTTAQYLNGCISPGPVSCPLDAVSHASAPSSHTRQLGSHILVRQISQRRVWRSHRRGVRGARGPDGHAPPTPLSGGARLRGWKPTFWPGIMRLAGL